MEPDKFFRLQTSEMSISPCRALGPIIDLVGGTMETSETVVLCPNCRWSAQGANEQELKAAKDYHALYECPLPKTSSELPRALAS